MSRIMVKGRSSARKSVFLSSTHIGVHIGVRPQCGQPSVNLGAY